MAGIGKDMAGNGKDMAGNGLDKLCPLPVIDRSYGRKANKNYRKLRNYNYFFILRTIL